MSTARSTASGSRRPPADAEAGTGLVGTTVGFAIFLVLLLFAAQVLIRLYADSTLTSAATRAAEQVAGSGEPGAATAAAESAARRDLGSFGAGHTSFLWEEADADRVVLRVRAEIPGLLPLPAQWRAIDRTVTVRTERFR